MGFILSDATKTWPNGLVLYRISKLASSSSNPDTIERLKTMQLTFDRWASLVNKTAGKELIRFQPVDTVPKEFHICLTVGTPGPGGYTIAGTVGRNELTGKAIVSLCGDYENYPHEVGHILGLGHEHRRSDSKLTEARLRDNIPESARRTAIEQDANERQRCRDSGNYNFKSIMHYPGFKSKVMQGDQPIYEGGLSEHYNLPPEWAAQGISSQRNKADVINGTFDLDIGDINSVVTLYRNAAIVPDLNRWAMAQHEAIRN